MIDCRFKGFMLISQKLETSDKLTEALQQKKGVKFDPFLIKRRLGLSQDIFQHLGDGGFKRPAQRVGVGLKS